MSVGQSTVSWANLPPPSLFLPPFSLSPPPYAPPLSASHSAALRFGVRRRFPSSSYYLAAPGPRSPKPRCETLASILFSTAAKTRLTANCHFSYAYYAPLRDATPPARCTIAMTTLGCTLTWKTLQDLYSFSYSWKRIKKSI